MPPPRGAADAAGVAAGKPPPREDVAAANGVGAAPHENMGGMPPPRGAADAAGIAAGKPPPREDVAAANGSGAAPGEDAVDDHGLEEVIEPPPGWYLPLESLAMVPERNPGQLDAHLLGGLIQGFDVCVAEGVVEVVAVHAGWRTWPHHRCYHRGGMRVGIVVWDAGCLNKIPSTELFEPHPPPKHRSPRSVQNDLIFFLHSIERHDIEGQTRHNSNVGESHTHILFTVQV